MANRNRAARESIDRIRMPALDVSPAPFHTVCAKVLQRENCCTGGGVRRVRWNSFQPHPARWTLWRSPSSSRRRYWGSRMTITRAVPDLRAHVQHRPTQALASSSEVGAKAKQRIERDTSAGPADARPAQVRPHLPAGIHTVRRRKLGRSSNPPPPPQAVAAQMPQLARTGSARA